ncbi:MAG: hypothetical protein GW760_09270 [Legionella sp.]|jgi:hypothetical protein|nr:hypothetical protein [Legionella sp.]
MFKKPDGVHGEPKRESLIPSEGSAFTAPRRLFQPPNLPPRKKTRPDKQALSEKSCDVTPEVRPVSCVVM